MLSNEIPIPIYLVADCKLPRTVVSTPECAVVPATAKVSRERTQSKIRWLQAMAAASADSFHRQRYTRNTAAEPSARHFLSAEIGQRNRSREMHRNAAGPESFGEISAQTITPGQSPRFGRQLHGRYSAPLPRTRSLAQIFPPDAGRERRRIPRVAGAPSPSTAIAPSRIAAQGQGPPRGPKTVIFTCC
jgi:hypothetical protein